MCYLSLGSDLSVSSLIAFGFSPGPPEMLIILVIALLLYGGKLPEMARTWGKTLAEFRRSLSGIQNEFNDAMYSAKDQLAIDQKEWQPENDPYLNDQVNETSGYDEETDEENQDAPSIDGTPDDAPVNETDSANETSTDSESPEELSSEKQAATDSD